MPELAAPVYIVRSGIHAMFAVSSMREHTTDEGWQLAQGLEASGYILCGHGLPGDCVDVGSVLSMLDPAVVAVQDKREWKVRPGNFRDTRAEFRRVELLRDRKDVFKLTVLKDAQHDPAFHRESADEIGCHAWITYYHPKVVKALASYVREEHLVRTYHSLDKDLVPPYADRRRGCIISGALSNAYPLRMRLAKELRGADVLPHPGYHRRGCATPQFLRTLSQYRVAVCTSSVYGYTLRKLMEATACGCAVVTDLPSDDVLPEIDGNLHRVDSSVPTHAVWDLVQRLQAEYDPAKQKYYADCALRKYDYRAVGAELAESIETLRRNYP